MHPSKIVIGTANFGMLYGLQKKKVKISEIKKIMKFAIENNINTLDTASAYNSAEKNLGKIGLKKWNIITKIPKLPNNVNNVEKWFQNKILSSFKNLKVKKINTLMLHDTSNIINKKKFSRIYNEMNKLKKKKIIKKIGISIYDSKIGIKILKKYSFDVVQAPFNILDDRIITSGLIKILKKKKINLHLRSIFLQGLLLENKIPKKFSKRKILNSYQSWLKDKKISNIKACIGALSKIKFDKVIIGIQSFNQLREIIKLKNYKIKNNPNFNIDINDSLIDPRKWKTI